MNSMQQNAMRARHALACGAFASNLRGSLVVVARSTAEALGLQADAKMLIDRARVESRNHWFTHDRLMPVESIAQVKSSSNRAKKLADNHTAQL